MIAAFNPASFGAYVWRTYPTVRVLMEMVITRQWRFPPLTTDPSASTILADDAACAREEKEYILALENSIAQGVKSNENVTV